MEGGGGGKGRGGRAGSSRLRLDSGGGAGRGEFVEAAAAPGGVQVTLKWFLVLLPKAVWF